MEALGALLAILALVAVAGGGAALAGRRRRAFEEALRQVGDPRGLQLTPATFWKRAYLSGATEGVDVCVDTYVVSTGKSSTTYTRVRTRGLPESLRIGSEGVLSSVGKALGVREDVEVGDPAFDGAVTIAGEPAARIVARMTPGARAAIREAVAAGGKARDGAWTVTVHGVITDPERLERLVRVAVAASRALIDGDASREALRARVDDPVRGVGDRALELAVREGAPDEWLARVAEGGDPRRVLVAARARAEAGRARLWWLVDRAEAPFDREAAVALASLPPDGRASELEEVLVRSLAEEPRVEVVRALGRVASVRAVAPLRTLDFPGGLGELASASREAVREIQARASGEAGGLALAGATGGELAEADEKSRMGRLSQARGRERA